MLPTMTQPAIDQLVRDLNLMATLPAEGTEAFARCMAALARVQAGEKLSEKAGHTEVIYLVAPQVMIKITCTDGLYHAQLYDEQVH